MPFSSNRHPARTFCWSMIFPENRCPHFGIMLLVVVHDLDRGRAFRRPNKAHPELVVDPDRVLPLAIARQRLKTVAWRRPQVAEIACGVEVAQLPACHLD